MDAYAKLQISELLARSAYAVDHKDFPAIAATFHKDAAFTLQVAGQAPSVYSGLTEIMDLMESSLNAQTDVRRHVVSNLWYAQTGDNMATVVSYLSLCATENDTTRLLTTGIYTDQVARKALDGGWLITDRKLELDGAF